MSSEQQAPVVSPAWNGSQWMIWTGTEWIPAPPPPKKRHNKAALVLVIIIGLAFGFVFVSCMNNAPTPTPRACPSTYVAPGDLVGSFQDGFNKGLNGCP